MMATEVLNDHPSPYPRAGTPCSPVHGGSNHPRSLYLDVGAVSISLHALLGNGLHFSLLQYEYLVRMGFHEVGVD